MSAASDKLEGQKSLEAVVASNGSSSNQATPTASDVEGGSFLHRKVINPLISVMKSGMSAEGIAWSIAFGITCGLFPVPGITSVAGAVFIVIFRLNPIACTAVNYMMTPFNLMTVIPLIRLGEYILGAEAPISFSMDLIKDNLWGFVTTFWASILRGIFAWALLMGPATVVLYVPIVMAVRAFMDRQAKSD